jgi:hypothetical protein
MTTPFEKVPEKSLLKDWLHSYLKLYGLWKHVAESDIHRQILIDKVNLASEQSKRISNVRQTHHARENYEIFTGERI